MDKNTINKDELTEAVRKIEYTEMILGDILEDYFDEYDEKNEKDTWKILQEFNRNRFFVGVCLEMIHTVKKELHENNIYCYR